jgi:hypothetical protein
MVAGRGAGYFPRMRDIRFFAEGATDEARKARAILWCAAIAAVVSLGASVLAGPY